MKPAGDPWLLKDKNKSERKKMFLMVNLPGAEEKVLASPCVTWRRSGEVLGEGPRNPSISGDGQGRQPQGWGNETTQPVEARQTQRGKERPTQNLLCGCSLQGLDRGFQARGTAALRPQHLGAQSVSELEREMWRWPTSKDSRSGQQPD